MTLTNSPSSVPVAGANGQTDHFEEVSAGGVVVDLIDGVPSAVIIARRNRLGKLEWCLPKGHIENRETPQEAAIREIWEETGLTVDIIKLLGSVSYWFNGWQGRIHKVVYHYLMEAQSGNLTYENDPDKEIEDVTWVPLRKLASHLVYPNERRLAGTVNRLLLDK